MVVKFDKWGNRYHEPPYTKAEEAEFYRRIGGGPVTVARPASDKRTNKKAQKSVAIKRADPLRQRQKKGGVAREVCHRDHRYSVLISRLPERDAHLDLEKIKFSAVDRFLFLPESKIGPWIGATGMTAGRGERHYRSDKGSGLFIRYRMSGAGELH
jgi:hypothetical protein